MNSRLREAIAAYDPSASLPEAATIPSTWYTDPAMLDLERRQVFARSWQPVARVDQVRQPGRFVTADVAGEPIMVVRGRDEVLRGFFNVCRHHAAQVMTEPAGCAKSLRCPYHGWTYSLEGELKGVPEFDGVRNFDKSQNGLIPIRVDAWEQFIFVCLDPRAPRLTEFLGELPSRVAPLNIAELKFLERRTYEIRCNWKVFVDNYLDGGYHVPHIHKALGSVLDYSAYTIENIDRFCVQSSPIAAGGDADTAAVRTGEMAYYYWLHPNFMLNWYEGVMDTNLVLPLAVDRCLAIFDFYFDRTTSESEARNRQSIRVAERVQQEDIDICESVQRGLQSRAYHTGRLSVRREAGEHLFHRLLHADLTAE